MHTELNNYTLKMDYGSFLRLFETKRLKYTMHVFLKRWFVSLRNTVGNVNPVITKDLLDNGATCVLDLLHVYTSKMAYKLRLPLHLPPGVNMDDQHFQAVVQAWDEDPKSFVKSIKDKCSLRYCSVIFTDLEIQLIKNLLDLVYIFSQCSCEVKQETIEDETLKKLEVVNVGSDEETKPPSAKERTASASNKSNQKRAISNESCPSSEVAKQYEVGLYLTALSLWF